MGKGWLVRSRISVSHRIASLIVSHCNPRARAAAALSQREDEARSDRVQQSRDLPEATVGSHHLIAGKQERATGQHRLSRAARRRGT